MSGGIAVKAGKRRIWCGLERSDDTAGVFRPQGLALTAWGPQAPKQNERKSAGAAVLLTLREGSSPDGEDAGTAAPGA